MTANAKPLNGKQKRELRNDAEHLNETLRHLAEAQVALARLAAPHSDQSEHEWIELMLEGTNYLVMCALQLGGTMGTAIDGGCDPAEVVEWCNIGGVGFALLEPHDRE